MRQRVSFLATNLSKHPFEHNRNSYNNKFYINTLSVIRSLCILSSFCVREKRGYGALISHSLPMALSQDIAIVLNLGRKKESVGCWSTKLSSILFARIDGNGKRARLNDTTNDAHDLPPTWFVRLAKRFSDKKNIIFAPTTHFYGLMHLGRKEFGWFDMCGLKSRVYVWWGRNRS